MLLTLIQSFARFFASEIRKAASQMREEYQNDNGESGYCHI